MSETWHDEIFKEKKLLDVYVEARKVSSTRFNFWVSIAIFSVVLTYGLVNIHTNWSLFPREAVRQSVLTSSQMGLSFSSSILGFLITGFAIFSSIIKLDVFILLAKIPHKNSNISRLKFIFFNFLFIFVHYIAALSVFLLFSLVFIESGIFSGLFHLMKLNIGDYSYSLGVIVLSVIIGWMSFILLLLKSFIWNLYQSILLAIVAESAV